MLSWLEHEILDMSRGDYLVLYLIMGAGLCFLLYFGFRAFRRFRFIDATATSRIRSAAQGQVELKGLGEFMPNDTITSPFSGERCLWYHCTIDRRKRSGKTVTWTNISNEVSEHLFRLVDDTGECLIDPDHAQVIPEVDRIWRGHSPEYRKRRPRDKGAFALSFGNLGEYRFRERLIRPATPLYTLGWFHTVHSNIAAEDIGDRVDDLVRQWKLQPLRYLADFDLDRNGKIQQREWKAVRAAARRQVLTIIGKQKKEHHVLRKPPQNNLPFIISVLDEDNLVTRKKVRAYASVSAAFLMFSALVLMSSIRLPFAT